MAGHKGQKFYDVFLDYKIKLATRQGENIIDDCKLELLHKIQEKGSLMAAAESMKISYRNAWGSIKQAEELLQLSLVKTTRGGESGGASTLTDEAIQLIEAYDQLKENIDKSIHEHVKTFFHTINK